MRTCRTTPVGITSRHHQPPSGEVADDIRTLATRRVKLTDGRIASG